MVSIWQELLSNFYKSSRLHVGRDIHVKNWRKMKMIILEAISKLLNQLVLHPGGHGNNVISDTQLHLLFSMNSSRPTIYLG
jgi:hypothetical protein